MNEPKTPSAFAVAFAGLLDCTNLFSREEWARFLSLQNSSRISEWTSDVSLPRASALRMVLDVLRESRDIPPEPLIAFEEMLDRPSVEVSPFGAFMMPTVWAYILEEETLSSLGQTIRVLPSYEDRIVALADMTWTRGAVMTVLNHRSGKSS